MWQVFLAALQSIKTLSPNQYRTGGFLELSFYQVKKKQKYSPLNQYHKPL